MYKKYIIITYISRNTSWGNLGDRHTDMSSWQDLKEQLMCYGSAYQIACDPKYAPCGFLQLIILGCCIHIKRKKGEKNHCSHFLLPIESKLSCGRP